MLKVQGSYLCGGSICAGLVCFSFYLVIKYSSTVNQSKQGIAVVYLPGSEQTIPHFLE